MTALYAQVVAAAAATLGGDDGSHEMGMSLRMDDALVLSGVRGGEHPDSSYGRGALPVSIHIPGIARGDANVTGDGGPVAPIGGRP